MERERQRGHKQEGMVKDGFWQYRSVRWWIFFEKKKKTKETGSKIGQERKFDWTGRLTEDR